MRFRCFIALATALPLLACTRPPAVDPPLNPSPREAWVYELRTVGLPQPPRAVSMRVLYAVSNVDCLPLDPISGGPRLGGFHAVPVTVEPEGAGVYRTLLFADRIASADLYGKGACHWVPSGVESTIDDGSARFIHVGAPRTLSPQEPGSQLASWAAFDRAARPAAGAALEAAGLARLQDQPLGSLEVEPGFLQRFPADRYAMVVGVVRRAESGELTMFGNQR